MLLDEIDDGSRVEPQRAGATKDRRDRIDLVRGFDVLLRFQTKARNDRRERIAPLRSAELLRERCRQLFKLFDDGEVVIDERPAPDASNERATTPMVRGAAPLASSSAISSATRSSSECFASSRETEIAADLILRTEDCGLRTESIAARKRFAKR